MKGKVHRRAVLVTLGVLGFAAPGAAAEAAVDFSREVYPILQQACFECHGDQKQKGDLRLEVRLRQEETFSLLTHHNLAEARLERRANALYAAGVENLFLWDCYQRNNFDPSWTTLTWLGHREELAEWAERGGPAVVRPRRMLAKIGDWDLAYGTPG